MTITAFGVSRVLKEPDSFPDVSRARSQRHEIIPATASKMGLSAFKRLVIKDEGTPVDVLIADGPAVDDFRGVYANCMLKGRVFAASRKEKDKCYISLLSVESRHS